MKTIRKTLVLSILVLALVLALISCSNQKSGDEEDRWINGEVDVNSAPHFARPQEFADVDDGAYQSGDRIDLPTIPLD